MQISFLVKCLCKRNVIATKKYLGDAYEKEQNIWLGLQLKDVHVKQCLSVAGKQKTLTRALKP